MDGVASKDRDSTIIVARNMCFNANLSSEIFQVHNKDNNNDSNMNPICQGVNKKYYLIGAMIGCDYLPLEHAIFTLLPYLKNVTRVSIVERKRSD